MGDAVADKKLIDSAAADLSKIAGQKAITTSFQKRYFQLQIKKRNAYWNKGHPSWRQDV